MLEDAAAAFRFTSQSAADARQARVGGGRMCGAMCAAHCSLLLTAAAPPAHDPSSTDSPCLALPASGQGAVSCQSPPPQRAALSARSMRYCAGSAGLPSSSLITHAHGSRSPETVPKSRMAAASEDTHSSQPPIRPVVVVASVILRTGHPSPHTTPKKPAYPTVPTQTILSPRQPFLLRRHTRAVQDSPTVAIVSSLLVSALSSPAALGRTNAHPSTLDLYTG